MDWWLLFLPRPAVLGHADPVETEKHINTAVPPRVRMLRKWLTRKEGLVVEVS